MTPAPLLSIVLPSYNNGRCIPATIDHIRHTCPAATEVLVVIDGSTDGSLAELHRRKWRRPSVRILAYSTRRGKGAAVRKGVLAARGRYVAFIDADRAIDPSAIAQGLQWMERDPAIHAVIGRRNHYRTSIMRHIAHTIFHWITYLLFRMPYHDTQAPMKIFRAPLAKKTFARLQTKSYAFDIEVLFRVMSLGVRVGELPVSQHKTASSLRWTLLPTTAVELLHVYRTYIAQCVIRLLTIRRKSKTSIDLFSLRHLLLWPLSWPVLWIMQCLALLVQPRKIVHSPRRASCLLRPLLPRQCAAH